MSSVKMFESISRECQPIFALEKALECLHFITRKYKLFGLKNKKWSKRRLLWKNLSDCLCLLISCKNPSLFVKDQLMCPLQLHGLQGRCKQQKWFWVDMFFILYQRPYTDHLPGVSRARPWRSRAVGRQGFQFSIIDAPVTLPCLKLFLPPSLSLRHGVQLSYCPSLGPRVSNSRKE